MKKEQLTELIRFLNEVTDTVQVPRNLRVRAYGLSIRINSEHTGEARTLEENEAKKEFTQRLLNKIHDIDPEYVYLVNNEFWNLFE